MNYYIHPSKNRAAKEFMVMSSGLGGHANFWNPQIETFSQYFHILTYDQEGCHASAEYLIDQYSMTNMAKQVLNILDQENIEKFHFVGHALGGHIGAELATLIHEDEVLKNKTKLLSLTSINAWDNLDPHTEKCFSARTALLEYVGAEAYIQAQALFLYPPAWISKNIKQIELAEQKQGLDFPPKHNVFARLNALKKFKIEQKHIEALKDVKVHLIANQDDFLVPYQKTLDLYQTLGHGTYSILENGGHASTVTEPEMMNQAVINFLIH
ncbi:pyrimidine utilization protein D [Acinetobacter equi]|uniref:Aminoacrylate hydrolase n=1 Tax=Acinetobacter equi TaxID=1324350 RepID=A0A0N9WG12_9GAMM|nr:pyrimidine utilization protein D [Acinetobacter equi]ALH96424.1 aminoacrylate hydrolase [Acinetobacter equi]